MPDDTKTPEPVRWLTRTAAAALLLLTQLNPAAEHFGWWHLSLVDLDYVGQVVGAFGAAALLIAGGQVRDLVMPMRKVDKVVEAARAEAPPGGIVGMTEAEQTRWNPPAP